MIDISVIIVNYNTCNLTLDCLTSILNKKWKRKVKITLVDNGSSDNSVTVIKERLPQVRIIQSSKNLGFARGNNLALKKECQTARYCFLLNSDTIITPESLDILADFLDKGQYGIVSCKLIDPDGSFQANTGNLPDLLSVFIWLSGLDDLLRFLVRLHSYQERNQAFYKGEKEVGWVSGSVMAVNSKMVGKIGLLDENIFMYGEDVEYCLRAKHAGYRIGWTDKAKIVHIGGASSKDPKYNQWLGEFRGLIYLYKKYYSRVHLFILKLLFVIFIFLRVIAFFLIGRTEYAKTYAKILKTL